LGTIALRWFWEAVEDNSSTLVWEAIGDNRSLLVLGGDCGQSLYAGFWEAIEDNRSALVLKSD
jgi:hypothetical protein